ncbi:MAG: 3-phosphoglycerate dehydrogenase [Reyranella sp.]|jgi:D-3-phosphoglycerate dehydrogenase|uniref:NAD(P)-dependent oxidoreductase n=1 Tax=Reyranella sp. TaxID=1929291 RepID=UPI0025E1BA47|nr:NAD(P)-dependent oxidoreductase [Reyranella sp.]MBR2819958.1 3-phosphoglycerate dehydrogenase [Reyranella sp.]
MPTTLFIDSTPDIDRVWKRVYGPGDPAITVNMGPVAEAAIPAAVAGYDTVINDATYFTEATLAACPGLRHIVFLGTGAASFVDLAAAARLGIKVSTIGGYGDTTVAEHAMGLVFAAARHIADMHADVKAGGWRPRQGMELSGKTLGIVGLGGIGREMARLGRGIGFETIAWNRSPLAEPLVPLVALGELLERAHVVSLHLALNDATRGFLDRAKLARLRPGAILVNTARAGIVDEAALVERLRAGQLGHYATDVFSHEPPSPDDPLLKLDNVTLTAHAGYNTPEAAMTMYRRAIDLAAKGV